MQLFVFLQGFAPFFPSLRCISINCDDLPLILHQGITPDTSPGYAAFGYTVSDRGLLRFCGSLLGSCSKLALLFKPAMRAGTFGASAWMVSVNI